MQATSWISYWSVHVIYQMHASYSFHTSLESLTCTFHVSLVLQVSNSKTILHPLCPEYIVIIIQTQRLRHLTIYIFIIRIIRTYSDDSFSNFIMSESGRLHWYQEKTYFYFC